MALTKGMIHGIFMLLGFGLLMPMGAIAARLLKHRPNNLWFRIHRGIQLLGLLLGLIGFSIAILNFDVFAPERKGDMGYKHGCLGVTAMVLALLQPINAFFRPKKALDSSTTGVDPVYANSARSSSKRWKWELAHKCFGYLSMIFAVGAIVIGTGWEGPAFQYAYYIGVLGFLLLFAAYCSYDRCKYQSSSGGSNAVETEIVGNMA